MDYQELQDRYNALNKKQFVSSAHVTQHRIFGFITTNIRSINTLVGYINELVPQYISRKKNYQDWENWSTQSLIIDINKQKFRRLELAKILFRKVKQSPKINIIAEKLYRISNTVGEHYLEFILNLYLLSGRYFDIDNQPLVEIRKIISLYNGDFEKDALSAVLSHDVTRLDLAMIFYNPAVSEALDISYDLLQNKISDSGIKYLQTQVKQNGSLLNKRVANAAGSKNFKKDIAICLNYYLFYQACVKNTEKMSYDNIISDYVEKVFSTHFNYYFNIDNKDTLLKVLLSSPNKVLLKDIFEFALNVKFDNNFVRYTEHKSIKQQAMEKCNYKCFFDLYSVDTDVHNAHELNYFCTQKEVPYLEGHHMIQMENSKFFEKDIDVVENIVPVCPNCHRKLHNAKQEVVHKMIQFYYEHCNKKDLIKKGIFVDIETLERFYGIEEK